MAACVPQVGRGAHANLTLHRRKKCRTSLYLQIRSPCGSGCGSCEKRVDVAVVTAAASGCAGPATRRGTHRDATLAHHSHHLDIRPMAHTIRDKAKLQA
ncbi:hypothetical protein IHV71_24200, partial [Escherichia coli]|uniref:hypothetical protein n=1 Tax=Escherichia coli TaxID=562 RepID=UPI001F3E9FA6